MKIGLLGGTFNPVHYGHLINAEIIREAFQLDKVLFIPSRHPVHKVLEGNISSDDRFKMVELAVSENPYFEASRIELDRPDESYFITTIKQLFTIYKNSELFLLIGTDAFNEVDTWKNADQLLQMLSFIIMERPGYDQINTKIMRKAKDVKLINNPLIEISSSGIRSNIRNGKSIRYLVPPDVGKYIIKKELYKF
ncbi:MAG: nicotinate-nucleotide adenylyltransferase [Spirochaetota bacterium]